MKLKFVTGYTSEINEDCQCIYSNRYGEITGFFRWANYGKTFRIIVVKQETLFYTFRVLLHEYLHYLNFIILKNDDNYFNNLIEKYI